MMKFAAFMEEELVSYYNDLSNFNFSFSNPWLWISMVLLFLALSRLWHTRKAFSFCFVLIVVLIFSTIAQNFTEYIPIEDTAVPCYSLIVKMATFLVVSVITIYYFFIGSD